LLKERLNRPSLSHGFKRLYALLHEMFETKKEKVKDQAFDRNQILKGSLTQNGTQGSLFIAALVRHIHDGTRLISRLSHELQTIKSRRRDFP